MILSKIGGRLKKAFKVDKKIGHIEWAEKYMTFSGQDVSPFPGKLSLKRSAHLRLPLKLMDDPKKRRFAFAWASQTAKTLIITIPVAKKLDTDPSWIHWIYPVKDKVQDLVRIKLDKTLKSIPKIWDKFKDFKEEEKSSDKRTVKEIAGGGLYITGTTPNDLKSISTPLTVADESGEMKRGTLVEAEERQKSFSRVFPRTISASTLVHPEDENFTFFKDCECKLSYEFICPECNGTFADNIDTYKLGSVDRPKTFFVPTRAEYAITKDIGDTDALNKEYLDYIKKESHLKCPHCSRKIFDTERTNMLYDGIGAKWVTLEGDIATASSIGTIMGSLMAWVVTMDSAVEAVYKAEGSIPKLDKLYRNWFNQFYEDDSSKKTDSEDLLLIGNGIEEYEVPEDTAVIYHIIDTQKDYFWDMVIAYSYGVKVSGVSKLGTRNILSARRREDFGQLVEIMERKYYYEDGSEFTSGIRRQMIDVQGYVNKSTVFNEETNSEEEYYTANRPQEVKEYIDEFSEYYGRDGEHERLYGSIGTDFLTNERSYMFINTEMESERYIGNSIKKEKKPLKVIKLATVSLKLSAMMGLTRSILKAKAKEEDREYEYVSDLTYINQTQIDECKINNPKTSIIEQLTSERYEYKRDSKGNITTKKKMFVQKKKENHLFDCLSGAEAFAQLDDIKNMSKPLETDKETSVYSSIADMLG